MNVQFVEVSGGSSQTCMLPYVYIKNQFQPTFAREGGRGVKHIVEVTVNSKEEKS
jgi:hypothetical protein